MEIDKNIKLQIALFKEIGTNFLPNANFLTACSRFLHGLQT